MKLALLVATSGRVAATRSRREKIHHLAEILTALPAPAIRAGVAYLVGELPQGRIGIGGAVIERASAGATVVVPTLELCDVDAAFDRMACCAGAGSTPGTHSSARRAARACDGAGAALSGAPDHR